MKIAVLSDCHDHLANLARALELVQQHQAEHLLYLGDFCAPFTLTALAEGFSGPIDAVLGNNDGDPLHLCRISAKFPQVTLHEPLAELEIGGKKIALHHYPEVGIRLAESQVYDAVFTGHDHRKYTHQKGRTLWANPGEIMGRYGEPSFGIYDTVSGGFLHVDLGGNRPEGSPGLT